MVQKELVLDLVQIYHVLIQGFITKIKHKLGKTDENTELIHYKNLQV